MSKILVDKLVLEQALEALEKTIVLHDPMRLSAITAIRTALAQQAEPVAWMYPDDYAGILKHQSRAEVFQKAWCNPAVCVPLYTAPPQRKPLTDEEIKACEKQAMVDGALPFEQRVFFARAIEQAHGIGVKE